MIRIKKKHALAALKLYAGTPGASYKRLSEDEANIALFKKLRSQLLEEQKYLCCYCQQRIDKVLDANRKPLMKTEHFLPKLKYPNRELDYSNLLAACLGNGNTTVYSNHCDSQKGDKELKFVQNPASGKFEELFSYVVLPRSREVRIVPIEPHKSNEDLKYDIEHVLNLNEQRLRSRRFSTWERVIRRIGFDPNSTYTITPSSAKHRMLIQVFDEFNFDKRKTHFEEFNHFISSYLKKRFNAELNL